MWLILISWVLQDENICIFECMEYFHRRKRAERRKPWEITRVNHGLPGADLIILVYSFLVSEKAMILL
jgi:hypothetical protein